MTELLDNFRELEVQRAADTRELKQGLTALTAETKKLAEAQQRTDLRMGELVEAQQRTDSRMGELAEAQRKTEDSLTPLERATEKLVVGFVQLRDEVGGLANRFGFDFEEFVAALLPPYLERHQRISGLTLERRYFELGGGRVEEVDLAGEGVAKGNPSPSPSRHETTREGRKAMPSYKFAASDLASLLCLAPCDLA